jgi:hypothetical protein
MGSATGTDVILVGIGNPTMVAVPIHGNSCRRMWTALAHRGRQGSGVGFGKAIRGACNSLSGPAHSA